MGKFFKMAESYEIPKKDWNEYRNKKALERIAPVSAITGIAGFGIGAALSSGAKSKISKMPIKTGLIAGALAGSAGALYGTIVHNKNKLFDFKQILGTKTPRQKLYDSIGIENNSELRVHPKNGADALYLKEDPGGKTVTLYNAYVDKSK